MTISQKIFKILEMEKLSQKDFSERTGIPQSTISDWRKKNTNPASDKILIICEVLKVTPYDLLSGVEEEGSRSRSRKLKCKIIAETSEENLLLEMYGKLNRDQRNRLLGYIEALAEKK